MKTKFFLLSIGIVMFLASCQKDEVELSLNKINGNEELLIPCTATLVDEKSVVQSKDTEVAEAEVFAKLLASSINSKEVRKFLKEEACKKFDGDFDILVSKVLLSKVGSVSFKEKVESSSSLKLTKAKEVFESAIKNPKLNISVPLHIEKWDNNKQQLLVAVAVGIIDGETEFVKAYDSYGRLYLIDAKTEPNLPVIVIGNNERIDYEEYSNEKSARTPGNMERITYIRCPDISKIESWLLGSPELKFDIVYCFNNSGIGILYRNPFLTRSEASNGCSISLDLFNWWFGSTHGPNYYIHAWEKDDGATNRTITVSVLDNLSVWHDCVLSYRSVDENLGGSCVDYSSTTPQTLVFDNIFFTLSN
jgi:hypothetical protein